MPRDLISIDNLSPAEINQIHNLAQDFFNFPLNYDSSLLEKVLVNFFFENSTRTRTSFEIAARRMQASVVNIDISLSSLKKGESIIDTAKTIAAMQPDFVAIRHNASGILDILKKYIPCCLINAGDGTNEHPSQALLDSFVIKQHKKDLSQLTIAICGDVLHSRVAHSNIKLLKKFGAKIRVITPSTLIPSAYRKFLKERFDIEVFENLKEGILQADVIMMLRIQQERMLGCYIPSLSEYFKLFGLTHE
jgi:aspartate carbamoyltransferase catalytic subunit